MKKGLMIFGGIALGVIVLIVAIFLLVSATSDKLICKSEEGNITIMYNDTTITGYTANGITYDFEGQKALAEDMGTETYMEEFMVWFSSNTTGSCEKKEK